MAAGILGRHPARVLVVIAALLVVLNLAYFLGREQDSSEPGESTLPARIESVAPEPGSTTGKVVDVVADLENDLTGGMAIDGVCVPLDQLEGEDSPLSTLSFRPQEGYIFDEFDAGLHEVTVYFRDETGPVPDNDCDASFEGVSAYRWSFRAAA